MLVSREPLEGVSIDDDTGRIQRVGESVTVVVLAVVANLLNALVYDAVAVVVGAVAADIDAKALLLPILAGWGRARMY